jgi:Fic family protein
MRISDVSPKLRPYLEKSEAYPNCYALVPPPTPRLLPPDPVVAQDIAAAMQALEGLRIATKLLPNVDMVTRTLARREAVQSSQIEGTQTQLHELFEYEATQSSEGLPADATVTERYVEALDLGLGELREAGTREALTTNLVKAMHATLMKGAPDYVRPGEYRDTQAWIGNGRIEDATFVSAPPGRISECMEELAGSMLRYEPRDDEQWKLQIVAQIAIAHAQFETIHPFADGNGRTGRLLMPVILAADGYPPLYLSGRLLRLRRAYYDSLASVQLQANWVPWLRLLSQAVVEACDGAISIATDLDKIRGEWQTRLSELRADATAHKLPTFLLGHPVVSANQLAKAFDISFVAANRALEQLVARDILKEPKQRRNRVFHASAILERLEAL